MRSSNIVLETGTPQSNGIRILVGVALIIASLTLSQQALAMQASPHPIVEEQPDGSPVEVYMRGDERQHWMEDRDGFTVVLHDGWFVYGRSDKRGRLVPTRFRVGRDDPRRTSLRRGVRPPQGFSGAGGSGAAAAEVEPGAAPPPTGSLANLVVLLRFSNHAFRGVPTQAEINTLFNAQGGDSVLAPTGSVRDAYLEYSHGQLTIDSTVVYWVDLPNSEQYYAAGQSGLTSLTHSALRYALNVLDADPNFRFADFDLDQDGEIDAITFLHSGYGAEWGGVDADGTNYTDRIWSHKWVIFGGWVGGEGVRIYSYNISPSLWGRSGNGVGRIGVICHELGHVLGLPDLYDTDGTGEGIGSYGLMANSWGFDGSQHYPPHLSPWSRIQLGWTTATEIETGEHSLADAETSGTVYKISLGTGGEHLLIENRQPVGLDFAMPQGGLAIWHIDPAASCNNEGYPGQVGWPENGNHYCVALLQADGNFDLERGMNRGDRYDVFHADGVSEIGPNTLPDTNAYQYGNIVVGGQRIFDISAAASTMTFSLNLGDAPECSDGIDNDGDGAIDYPDDPDCDGTDDLSEAGDFDEDGVRDDLDNCLDVPNADQLDSDADGYGNVCDADFDNNGVVGVSDFILLSSAWGSSLGSLNYIDVFDLDGSGTIGTSAFIILSGLWGNPPGPSGLACAGQIPCTSN